MKSEDKKRLYWGGGVILAVLLFHTIFGERGLLRVHQLGHERERLVAEARAVERENEELTRLSALLQNDLVTIEKTARGQLDLVREDEILYKFIGQ